MMRIAGSDESGHLSDVLEIFARSIDAERVALGTICAFTGRRSIGALLLILALPMALPVPAPGMSVIFGVPLVLVSLQLMIGRRTARLPQRLAAISLDRGELVRFILGALPRLRAFERIVKPRLGWMAGEGAMIPIGAICTILALIITLPIPLGHMVPGTAISLLALGLIERDGLAIAVGVVVAVVGCAIVAFASMGAVVLLREWIGALSS
jgi:hypothetical protein